MNLDIRRSKLMPAIPIAALLAALGLVACGSDASTTTVTAATDATGAAAADVSAGLPQGSEPVELDPADFTTTIDNPYWPMSPGSRWIYEETDVKGDRIKVKVRQGKKNVTGWAAAAVFSTLRSDHLWGSNNVSEPKPCY